MRVQGCILIPAAGPAAWVRRIFCRLAALWALAPEEAEAGREESREAVNRRAEQALDRYGNSILRLAYSYLHNMSDAEEILQDTLVQLLKTDPAFQSEDHEKAWLLRVAANLSKNRLDYNQVRKTDVLSQTLAAQEREDLSFVWEAVKSLPPNERAAIHLFYQEDCTTRQIGAILGRREATVRSDLHRGRLRLREILKEVYDFGGPVS